MALISAELCFSDDGVMYRKLLGYVSGLRRNTAARQRKKRLLGWADPRLVTHHGKQQEGPGVAEDVTSLYCGIKPFCSMDMPCPFTSM